MTRLHRITIFLLAATLALTGCTKRNIPATEYLQRPDWAPDVKSAVNYFIANCDKENAYAVFDFDNTTSIFDIEEQLIVHQLETMSFAMDPDELEAAISAGLDTAPAEAMDWVADISAAYRSLYDSYGPFTSTGLDEATMRTVMANEMWQEFAAKMGAMYDILGEYVSTDVSYSWVLFWFCGMTEDEVYALAKRSHEKYSKLPTSLEKWVSPADVPSCIGQVTFEWTCGVQVTENIKELYKALMDNGIDVWICSASGISQVKAAVDVFGLHDCVKGLLAMTVSHDAEGRLIPEYDFTNGVAAIPIPSDATSPATASSSAPATTKTSAPRWTAGSLPTKAQTGGAGKVTALQNALLPLYGGRGPIAGFMDSTGDYNFCTEFSSLRMVVCFNRANRKVTDGGGLVAETAIFQRDHLGLTMEKALAGGETLYLLQGRDENGLRTFRASNKTLRFGSSEEKLFANDNNQAQLDYFIAHNLGTADILNRFCIATSASESELGFAYGWLPTYNGFHSR